MCVCIHAVFMCVCMHMRVCSLEEDLQGWVLSFHHVGAIWLSDLIARTFTHWVISLSLSPLHTKFLKGSSLQWEKVYLKSQFCKSQTITSRIGVSKREQKRLVISVLVPLYHRVVKAGGEGRKLEVGTEEGPVKEHCLLVCFPRLVQPAFLDILGPTA